MCLFNQVSTNGCSHRWQIGETQKCQQKGPLIIIIIIINKIDLLLFPLFGQCYEKQTAFELKAKCMQSRVSYVLTP
jgi:hypothetical protein